MQGPMKPEELRRYAEMIVRGCIAFRRGDTLLEMVSLGHRELAVAVAEAAYRAGALAVDVQYDDSRAYAAKIAHGPKNALGHQTPWRVAQWNLLDRDDNFHVLLRLRPLENQATVGAAEPEGIR